MILLQLRAGLAIRGHDYRFVELGTYPHDLAVQTSEQKEAGGGPITANLAAVSAGCQRRDSSVFDICL